MIRIILDLNKNSTQVFSFTNIFIFKCWFSINEFKTLITHERFAAYEHLFSFTSNKIIIKVRKTSIKIYLRKMEGK